MSALILTNSLKEIHLSYLLLLLHINHDTISLISLLLKNFLSVSIKIFYDVFIYQVLIENIS